MKIRKILKKVEKLRKNMKNKNYSFIFNTGFFS